VTPRSAVLIAVEPRDDARLLADWLAPRHDVVAPEPADAAAHLDAARLDLCIVDAPTLDRLRAPLAARRSAEAPVALPVLLLVPRPDLERGAPDGAAPLADEILTTPLLRPELDTRIAALLSTRRLSLDLARQAAQTEALLDAMAHDLRTPLNTILLAATAMSPRQMAALGEAGRKDLETIARAGRRMRDILAELLRFSRLGRGGVALAPVDLRATLDECVRDLAPSIAQRCGEVVLPGAPPPVLADAALLKVALLGLLSNAILHTSPGVRPRAQVTAARAGDRCRIAIRDNGPGIPSDKLEKIFEPFARLQRRDDTAGVGLGLSAARKAVERMGGRSGVDSMPGEGSTFWIELACAPPTGEPGA